MSPTLMLTISAALFVAPATYILAASMLSHQGNLGGATISNAAEIVLWSAGGAALLMPLAIPRLVSSSARPIQLILILTAAVAASAFGLVLTFTTGRLAPIRLLGAASMLAILVWSWTFRDCFRGRPF